MNTPPADPLGGSPTAAHPGEGPGSASEKVMASGADACVTLPERVADVPAWDRGPLTGRLVQGRYLIKGLIGEGGMGSVYRAEHTLMGKELAIKVLLPELGQNESIARRFQQEAQSASRLEHPGIIQVTDFGATEEGNLFLVMSLLSGKSLTQAILQEAPLAPVRAIAIAVQIAEALHHAHSEGVVHRDMKPDNVMLIAREKGELVKLLDFGIARVTEGEGAAKGLTELGVVFGTPEYLSPEQAVGDPADARSDLYALGVILYEMLTGKRPFEAETAAGFLQAHVRTPPPRFGERVKGLVVPPAVENVTMRALAKAPADRFQSGQAFADALRSLQLTPFVLSGSALVSVPGVMVEQRKEAVVALANTDLALAVQPEATELPAPEQSISAADHGSRGRPPAGSGDALAADGRGGVERASEAAPALHEPPGLGHAVKVWGLVALGLVLFLLVVLLAVIVGSEGDGPKRDSKHAIANAGDASVLKETLDLATRLPEAERLLGEKKWSEAEAKLQALLGRWPRDPRVHLLLGHLHRARANAQACLGSYQTALLLEPSLREDAGLLGGLDALLGCKKGPGGGRVAREAAVAFAVGPFAAGPPLGPAARRTLVAFANRAREHDLVWKVVTLLEGQKAMEGVDLSRAYRLRFQSVEGCAERERYVDEMVARRDQRLLGLLRELYSEPHLRAPRGSGTVSNECLKEATAKAILALGGELPAVERPPPGRPSRRR